MTELGERLKAARKSKGYTLDDLQEITKIQKRYLAGIENEEFSSMPGSFYVRAFIKQYAEAVDLDPDEILALYKGSSAKVVEAEEERQIPSTQLTRRRSRNTNWMNEIMPKLIVALFIIVIILVFAFLWKHKASNNGGLSVEPDDSIQIIDDSKRPGNEKEDDTSEEELVEEPEEEEEEQVQTLEHVEVSGENSYYTLENSDTFLLEIRTSGPSWIGVMNENNEEISPEARTMQAGEKLELDASDVEKVRIRVGRTGETEIYVNGELLEYATELITQNIHIEFHKE